MKIPRIFVVYFYGLIPFLPVRKPRNKILRDVFLLGIFYLKNPASSVLMNIEDQAHFAFSSLTFFSKKKRYRSAVSGRPGGAYDVPHGSYG